VQVRAYVDAAYALHNDSRSHTGVIIFVGQTVVFEAEMYVQESDGG
jgi:hypothetical protein